MVHPASCIEPEHRKRTTMSKIIPLQPYLNAAMASGSKPTFFGYPRFAKEFSKPALALNTHSSQSVLEVADVHPLQ